MKSADPGSLRRPLPSATATISHMMLLQKVARSAEANAYETASGVSTNRGRNRTNEWPPACNRKGPRLQIVWRGGCPPVTQAAFAEAAAAARVQLAVLRSWALWKAPISDDKLDQSELDSYRINR